MWRRVALLGTETSILTRASRRHTHDDDIHVSFLCHTVTVACRYSWLCSWGVVGSSYTRGRCRWYFGGTRSLHGYHKVQKGPVVVGQHLFVRPLENIDCRCNLWLLKVQFHKSIVSNMALTLRVPSRILGTKLYTGEKLSTILTLVLKMAEICTSETLTRPFTFTECKGSNTRTKIIL
jgi:hypothetical protein